ncbi:MAG TPA: VWA domain-containing protein [Candidatus Acidoferrum sp.]|jgi:VWFA-related protein
MPVAVAPSRPLRFLTGFLLFIALPGARAQSPSATPQASPTTQGGTAKNSGSEEIVSHDTPATFQVRVNLVLVRVVVRDADGKAITNLTKEDFRLADERKPQIISSFSVETPASHVPTASSEEPTSDGTPSKAPDLPERFVTLFFDDLHLSTQDAMFSRQATGKLFAAMGPRDRIAILTSSGQVEQDFTGDRAKLEKAVQQILPHSLVRGSGGCPPMSLQEAFMIASAIDSSAMQVAIADYMACSGISPKEPGAAQTAANIVSAAASEVLNVAEAEIQRTYQSLTALVRRMSLLPGQRVIVMMSPGFLALPTMHGFGEEVIDRATKENVVINTIDARGLWVPSAYDANASVSPLRVQATMWEEMSQYAPLAELADSTGGIFFHDRNDIDQGLLHAAAEPEVSYVLGFTPQNLKLDGKYHTLKVTLTEKQKWTLQARRGYYAPRANIDREIAAKEEIQQAVFSQDELNELPVGCQTQFFKGADGVRLTVVTHVGTEQIKFRKVDGRNQDTLTITTGIFDENGSMISGLQRVLDLQLKDATLERANRTGLNVKLNFDVQPGTFLVRTVVRDSEGAQMGATTQGLVIP